MYTTVAELNEAIRALQAKHAAEEKPLKAMFKDIYNAQMASCTTLDEQWEVYKQCQAYQLTGSWFDHRSYIVKDFVIHYDVMDNEIKEPYEYNLVDWIATDDDYDDSEYISRSLILSFFETAEDIEIEERSNITKQYITFKIPKHVIDAWKRMLINAKAANIHVPRYF